MARTPGSFAKDANYELTVRKPLDARSIVSSYEDLLNVNSWTYDSKSVAYNGMLVAVVNISDDSNNGIYYFFDPKYSGLKGGTVTDAANWHKICSLTELNELTVRVTAIEESLGTTSGITEEELNTAIESLRQEIINKNYLTAADLEEYVTDQEVDEKITTAITDLPDYATTEQVNEVQTTLTTNINAVAQDLATHKSETAGLGTRVSQVESKVDTVSQKANTTEATVSTILNKLDNKVNTADFNNYKTEVSINYASKTELNTKADKSNTLSGYGITNAYTKTEVDNAIAKAKLEGEDVDLSGYATKDELATKQDTLVDSTEIDVEGNTLSIKAVDFSKVNTEGYKLILNGGNASSV